MPPKLKYCCFSIVCVNAWQVTVFISDPELPFIMSHNEIRLRPMSYARIPVRFLPVASRRAYTSSVSAQSSDGQHYTSMTFKGESC